MGGVNFICANKDRTGEEQKQIYAILGELSEWSERMGWIFKVQVKTWTDPDGDTGAVGLSIDLGLSEYFGGGSAPLSVEQ